MSGAARQAWTMDLGLNCTASYHAGYMPAPQADALFDLLRADPALTAPYVMQAAGTEHRVAFGKAIFLEPDLHAAATFPTAECSNQSTWPAPLGALAARLAADLGQNFQVCVAIHYATGTVDMGYHRDVSAFGDTSHIASISLGAERVFSLREIETGQRCDLPLAHGSLIYMGPGCQQRYEHAVPADPECDAPRVNLTFRLFGG